MAHASNMGFGVIGAGRCQLQLFIRYCAAVRAGRFSIQLLVVIFNFSFSMGLQLWADDFQIPQQRQAIFVAGYATWDICVTFLTIFMLFSGERSRQVYSGCFPDAGF